MGRDTMYEQVNKSTHVQCHVYATRTTKCNHKTLVQLTVITVQYTLYVQTLRDTHYTWKRAVLARLHSTQSCLPYAIINSLSLSQHVHTLNHSSSMRQKYTIRLSVHV